MRDASGVVAGILLFALTIHYPGPLRILSIGGLAGAGILIGASIRHTPLLHAFGISKPDRRMLLFLIPATLLGILLGMATRHKFGLSLFPVSLGMMALVTPWIGAVEELIFRGYLQGTLLPVGRIFSILAASISHTCYKLLVILSLSSVLQFDLFFLVLWTLIGGTAFGVLRDLSRSSIPPLTAHALFDVVLYGGMWVAPVWVWS
jgi:membrane protease YdiL (CAAX protease family)